MCVRARARDVLLVVANGYGEVVRVVHAGTQQEHPVLTAVLQQHPLRIRARHPSVEVADRGRVDSHRTR